MVQLVKVMIAGDCLNLIRSSVCLLFYIKTSVGHQQLIIVAANLLLVDAHDPYLC